MGHRDFALFSLFGLAFTGVTAWIACGVSAPRAVSSRSLSVILISPSSLSACWRNRARGGQINHPEIRVATDVLPTDPTPALSPTVEHEITKCSGLCRGKPCTFSASADIRHALAVSLRRPGLLEIRVVSPPCTGTSPWSLRVVTNVFSACLFSGRFLPLLNEITSCEGHFITIGAIAVCISPSPNALDVKEERTRR